MRDPIPKWDVVNLIDYHISQYDGSYSEISGAIVTELKRLRSEVKAIDMEEHHEQTDI